MLSAFDLIATLLVVTASFGWVNQRFLKLPGSMGLLTMALAASLVLLLLEIAFPQLPLYAPLVALMRQVDFQEAVLNGMLAFLLFAGALHVDLSSLRERAWVVATLATVGVAISVLVTGFGFYWLAGLLGMPLPLAWALVFGALIAPTDPVAVLATLKAVKVPRALETDISGESLFNDGVGVAIFVPLLAVALAGEAAPSFATIAEAFVVEAGGGAVLGVVTGWLAYRGMRRVDNYSLEVLMSLALVAGTYALAARLHISGPSAVVAAGLLLGNRGPHDAFSETTHRYMFGFWTLVDEILNAILFLLIGLEVVVLQADAAFGWLPLAAVPLALLARWVSVAGPVALLRRLHDFAPGTVTILTWGGLRGGISIALALSIPENPAKAPILAATYLIVLFTLLVQGLTLGRVARAVGAPAQKELALEPHS